MQRVQKSLIGSCSLLGAALLFSIPTALAADNADKDRHKAFSYAAKFVCDSNRGTIETSVNIHNPQFESVFFVWKVVRPNDQISEPAVAKLGPDEVASFECDRIVQQGSEFEGYFVVVAIKELDVVATYEIENGEETEDFDVERVKPVRVRLPKDMVSTLGGASTQ